MTTIRLFDDSKLDGIRKAGRDVYIAALKRAATEAASDGRLTAGDSAGLDHAQYRWAEALDRYAAAATALALRGVSEQITNRVRELRDSHRSGVIGIEYINGMEDADAWIERAIAQHELAATEAGQ